MSGRVSRRRGEALMAGTASSFCSSFPVIFPSFHFFRVVSFDKVATRRRDCSGRFSVFPNPFFFFLLLRQDRLLIYCSSSPSAASICIAAARQDLQVGEGVNIPKTREREDGACKCGLPVFGECGYSSSAEQRGRGCPQTPGLL